MDEEVIADLKQFIAGAITQQTADLRHGLYGLQQDIQRLRQDIQKLDRKMDDGFAAIADILENVHNATEVRLNNHERRLTRLEQKPALSRLE